MHIIHRATALLALVAAATTAHGATGAPPTDGCVDLGTSHVVHRAGQETVLVADGDAHYRLDLGSCGTLPLASRFAISTSGQAARLCPAGSRIKTDLESCRVHAVERIDAETYTSLRAKRGR